MPRTWPKAPRATSSVMDRVTFETRDHVAEIGLNRADKRNAFDLQMLQELSEAFTQFDDDDALRVAILFAHGDHFTGGLDLAEVGPHIAGSGRLFPEDGVDPLGIHGRRVRKPVIMTAQGWCLTIGVELALAADIRLAAEGVRFSQLEIKRGIFPFGGATMRMPALTGWGNAMMVLLTGDTFDAETALRMGLVQEVLPEAELMTRARELASRIAAQAPLAVQATLASARASLGQGPIDEAARLLDRARKLMDSEDAAEGMRSFVERREAKFTGR